MKITQGKGKFLRACLRKCRKLDTKAISPGSCDRCLQFLSLRSVQEKEAIPRDVPKGHLAVYVGEYQKRFVIKVTLLEHPLFRALLDHALEENGFTADWKLCIPCGEGIFLAIVRCAASPENQTNPILILPLMVQLRSLDHAFSKIFLTQMIIHNCYLLYKYAPSQL